MAKKFLKLNKTKIPIVKSKIRVSKNVTKKKPLNKNQPKSITLNLAHKNMISEDLQPTSSGSIDKQKNNTVILHTDIDESPKNLIQNITIDQLITIDLLIIKKISLNKENVILNKCLLSDGVEYIEFTQWGYDRFENYSENSVLKLTNFFVSQYSNNSEYYVRFNKNNFMLAYQEESVISNIEKVIDTPMITMIGELLNINGKYNLNILH